MFLITLMLPLFVIVTINRVVADPPRFRIVAPQLVCPKDEDSPIQKPDNTVITIQTNTDDLHLNWTVYWHPLSAPTQRFTLQLWRTTRALEFKLNGPQPEPFVYLINNDELLYGVNYIFNVTASTSNGYIGEPRSFYINNTFGEQTSEDVDGIADMSVVLVGSQLTFVDVEYVLEAVVTICVPFHDYHFSWKVHSSSLQEYLNISTVGSRLELPPYSVQAGMAYDVTCFILKDTTEDIITQIELPFEVGFRGLEVHLAVDKLIVGIHHGFTIESTVINHDYWDLPVTFHWRCSFNGMLCDFLEDVNENNLIIPSRFPTPGQYEVILTVSVLHQSSEARVTVTALDSTLPLIQIHPIPRVLNEGSSVSLIANASNLTPMCTLGWYFSTDEEFNSTVSIHEPCDECQLGSPITDTLTVFSLDENFLYELTDFSNDTEWRVFTVEVNSSAGRARFLVECSCPLTLECSTRAQVYADVFFDLNERPMVSDVMVYPSSGMAMETLFRVSCRPASDQDGPLRYLFYCAIGNNDTLLLGSYLEHSTVETSLPYIAGGTDIWVEVCDIRGACSYSDHKIIHLLTGEARSIHALMADISAHISRCEIMALQRSAVTAFVTYYNAGQTEALAVFTTFLLDSVPTLAQRCISQNYQQYLEFLNRLLLLGLDTSGLV